MKYSQENKNIKIKKKTSLKSSADPDKKDGVLVEIDWGEVSRYYSSSVYDSPVTHAFGLICDDGASHGCTS